MTAKDNGIENIAAAMEVQKGGINLRDIFNEAEPCTIVMLAELYHTERHDLERKLQPYRTIIGNKLDGYYSKEQVQKIYLLVGPPAVQVLHEQRLIVFPHNARSWKEACISMIRMIQRITKLSFPAYFCERSIAQERFLSRLEKLEEWEAEERIIGQIEKELVIYRHFAYYQPEIFDSSVDILERALTYYDLLLHFRNRQPIEIDEHLRVLARALLCYVQTGSGQLYCEIEKLLYTHNEKQLQGLVHQLAIETYCARFQ